MVVWTKRKLSCVQVVSKEIILMKLILLKIKNSFFKNSSNPNFRKRKNSSDLGICSSEGQTSKNLQGEEKNEGSNHPKVTKKKCCNIV